MSIHLMRQLELIKRMIYNLAELVQKNLKNALLSVENLDINLANEVIKKDREIDDNEIEIEEECLKMLALYQPVAIDLRFIVAILKMNNDLERIGDMAKNISESVNDLSQMKKINIENYINFQDIVKITLKMFNLSIQSIMSLDAELAKKVIMMDDELDKLFYLTSDNLKKIMQEQCENIEFYIHYLNIIRHLERVGDLSTNLAEDTIYIKEGHIIRHANYKKIKD